MPVPSAPTLPAEAVDRKPRTREYLGTVLNKCITVSSSNMYVSYTKFITVYLTLGNNYIWLTKILKILMQRITFACSLALPTLAGWVTTSVLGSWIRAQIIRRRLCFEVLAGTRNFWSNLYSYL